MATEIRVPTLGESVTEATIGKWFKKPGDAIKADEPLVELETDKVTLEVNAPSSGVLAEITTLATELDVSIADIEIAHSAEGREGVLIVLVEAELGPRLVDGLVGAGFRPSLRSLQ